MEPGCQTAFSVGNGEHHFCHILAQEPGQGFQEFRDPFSGLGRDTEVVFRLFQPAAQPFMLPEPVHFVVDGQDGLVRDFQLPEYLIHGIRLFLIQFVGAVDHMD